MLSKTLRSVTARGRTITAVRRPQLLRYSFKSQTASNCNCHARRAHTHTRVCTHNPIASHSHIPMNDAPPRQSSLARHMDASAVLPKGKIRYTFGGVWRGHVSLSLSLSLSPPLSPPHHCGRKLQPEEVEMSKEWVMCSKSKLEVYMYVYIIYIYVICDIYKNERTHVHRAWARRDTWSLRKQFIHRFHMCTYMYIYIYIYLFVSCHIMSCYIPIMIS